MNQSVTVLGAGIVGISSALELQRRGYRVTLLDRRDPGEETSAGNAGILSYSNVTPIASPALLTRMHRLLLNLDADFMMHYPHLPLLLPWIARFLLRCRRHTYLADGGAMSELTLASVDLHRQWIVEASLQSLLNRGGGLKLYRSRRTFERDGLERELLQRCGIRHTLMNRDQVYDLEPDLRRVFAQGVLIDESISVRDPQKLCKAYAQLFVDSGGKVRRTAVQGLRQNAGGWELSTDQDSITTAKLVICTGAWTPEFIAQIGYDNPLAIERGYHTVVSPGAGKSLSRPIFDVDAGYVMAPMETGLRVTTGSNLARREAKPTPRQVEMVLPRVREAFPVGEVLLDEPWMGRRPTVPDTLPIIGSAPRHENLWLAFAHSHMGLTLGPITGVMIANSIDGEQQTIPMARCDPARYL